MMRPRFGTWFGIAWILPAFLGAGETTFADKSGVKPQVLSLPKGPGSIEGLGGSFEPQLNTGTATYSLELRIPPGVAGHQPKLALAYNSGKGNGPFGIGWDVATHSIQRKTEDGVPAYNDALDTFVYSDGEDLVPLANGSWREENEGGFLRFRRVGQTWEATEKDGTTHVFGVSPGNRIGRPGGGIFKWLISSTTDTNGNRIEYFYTQFPPSRQIYIREIRYSIFGQDYQSVAFDYQDRPDWFGDFSSGMDVRTTKRCSAIRVLSRGSLVRRYTLNYDDTSLAPPTSAERLLSLSLLRRVTEFGNDDTTALPPVRFAYTTFNTSTISSVAISTAPGSSLTTPGTELLDVNADSLPDVIQTEPLLHRCWINLGNGQFGPVIDMRNPPAVSLTSSGAQLLDVDGDGVVDLLDRFGTGIDQLNYYRLDSSDSTRPGWQAARRFSDNLPVSQLDDSIRFLDVNSDKRVDAMQTSTDGYTYFLNGADGHWKVAAGPYVEFGVQFSDRRIQLADMNGDRLEDLIRLEQDLGFLTVAFWPMVGAHTWGSPVVMSPPLPVPEVTDSERFRVTDVNGDGLADALLIEPGALHLWLNRGGNTWADELTIPAPFWDSHLTPAFRFADMNGNGTVDLLYDIPGNDVPLQYVDFAPNSRPNLLRLVDNGLGKVTEITHQSSTAFMVAAKTTNHPWSSPLPIAVSVVSRVVDRVRTVVGTADTYITDFAYWDGYYDSVKKEFRGFGHVEVRENGDASAPTKVTAYDFDTGKTAEALKGKPIVQEVRDAQGKSFVRTRNRWTVRQLADGVDGRHVTYPFNPQTRTIVSEGTLKAEHLCVEHAYDDYGNMTAQRDYGRVNAAQADDGPCENPGLGEDEILTETEYIYDVDHWIVDHKKLESVRNLANELKAQTRFFYDDLPFGNLSRGNLTQESEWLDQGDRFLPTVRNVFDPFGNIVSITDANGHRRTIDYDSVLQTYPVEETIRLAERNLSMTATYDLGLGVVRSVRDFAGAVTDYEYDALARLVRILRPGGAEQAFTYQLADPVSHILTQVNENADGGTFDTFAYFDGLGRKLGTKIEAEADGGVPRWRYVDAVGFNTRRLVARQWLPYYSATAGYEPPDPAQPYSTSEFDVRDRTVKTTNPDGTFVRTVFEPLVKHVWDENDNAGAASPTSFHTDGRDRLIEVIERNGVTDCNSAPQGCYHTRYTWSVLGDLTRIEDAQANVKTLTYDSLRRKTAMNDPDRGKMAYSYDDVGNLIRTIDAKGQVITYAYDAANRILEENYLDRGCAPDAPAACDPPDVVYRYDAPSVDVDFGDRTSASATFTGGRLASVTDLSGEEHWSYDARGNTAWTVKKIRDPLLGVLVPFATQFSYDLMDRMTDLIYPDNDHARYVYNNASFVARIDGGPAGKVVVANFDYEPTGDLQRVDFGNGVVTTYQYDNRDRLVSLRTVSPISGELINYEYAFDPTSNITKITDLRPFGGPNGIPVDSPCRNTQVFAYDDLYRLTQVKYAPHNDPEAIPSLGQITYSYDAIGNMLSQTSPPPGMTGHIADPKVNLGVMQIGGTAGRFNRSGRDAGAPPGPHALTRASNGEARDSVFEYDDNGNRTDLEGNTLSWDCKDRLVRTTNNAIDIQYKYDHADRRVSTLVRTGETITTTLRPSMYFEVGPERVPVKYAFSNDIRIARITCMIDPSRLRKQRLWLGAGWNFVTLTVTSSEKVASILGGDTPAYRWTGADWALVDPSANVSAGEPIWVHAATSRLGSVAGSALDSVDSITIPSGLHPIGWTEFALVPVDTLAAQGILSWWSMRPANSAWTVVAADPPLLMTATNWAGPACAFWYRSSVPTTIDTRVTGLGALLYMHADHLGSITTITDTSGRYSRNVTYFPFGSIRSEWPLLLDSFDFQYGFGGKELDEETGLSLFGRRMLVDQLARFLSVDPYMTELDWAEPAAMDERIEDPQNLNSYSYALNRPLSFSDPSGLAAEDHSGGAAPETVTINIFYSTDRDRTGTLVLSARGKRLLEAPVLGRADTREAKRQKNPHRASMQNSGDTPTGGYEGKRNGRHSIRLTAVSGDALSALSSENPRKDGTTLIHDHEFNKPRDPKTNKFARTHGGLVPTNGCPRVSNETMTKLNSVLDELSGAGGQVKIVVRIYDVNKKGGKH